jgi:hypothetical protein
MAQRDVEILKFIRTGYVNPKLNQLSPDFAGPLAWDENEEVDDSEIIAGPDEDQESIPHTRDEIGNSSPRGLADWRNQYSTASRSGTNGGPSDPDQMQDDEDRWQADTDGRNTDLLNPDQYFLDWSDISDSEFGSSEDSDSSAETEEERFDDGWMHWDDPDNSEGNRDLDQVAVRTAKGVNPSTPNPSELRLVQ